MAGAIIRGVANPWTVLDDEVIGLYDHCPSRPLARESAAVDQKNECPMVTHQVEALICYIMAVEEYRPCSDECLAFKRRVRFLVYIERAGICADDILLSILPALREDGADALCRPIGVNGIGHPWDRIPQNPSWFAELSLEAIEGLQVTGRP